MSVYSGFATRQQQTKYNGLLETLVIALKKRIIKFYQKEECDEAKFKLVLKKIYKKMFLLEKGKFMVPKYSSCFTDLVEALHIDINFDTLSETSSRISGSFSLQPNDQEETPFKSKAMLQSKKNLLQTKIKENGLDSAFSLSRKINTLGIENQQEYRSSSLGVKEINQKPKGKVKLRQLKQLKQLRGTMHMPKVQDFLPKKEQIGVAFFGRPQLLSPNKQFKGFRRQKYSRNDIQVQEI